MSDRTRRGAPGGPLWLDVTRLLSRAGRGAISGIDRVELAWLDHLAGAEGARFLCRTTRGYLLIDGAGARHLAALARGQAVPGRADA